MTHDPAPVETGPDMDPAVVAAVTVAAEAVLRRAPIGEVLASPENRWRFSGRWFTPHHITRRQRPF